MLFKKSDSCLIPGGHIEHYSKTNPAVEQWRLRGIVVHRLLFVIEIVREQKGLPEKVRAPGQA